MADGDPDATPPAKPFEPDRAPAGASATAATLQIPFHHWAQGKAPGLAEAVRVKLGLRRHEVADQLFNPAELDATLADLLKEN